MRTASATARAALMLAERMSSLRLLSTKDSALDARGLDAVTAAIVDYRGEISRFDLIGKGNEVRSVVYSGKRRSRVYGALWLHELISS